MDDPNTGTPPEKQKWEELGFADEAAMLDAATAATDLRSKITEAEATLTKERAAKSKTDSDYMRQSNEIGALKKKLKEMEQPPEDKPPGEDKGPDDVLESLTAEETAVLDGVLNDPKNAELKKRVALGGAPAMAEFAKAYRAESPVDLSVSLFAGLKKKKTDSVQLSSISSAVKNLFKKNNDEERNNLAAIPQGGSPPEELARTKKQVAIGGVDVGFFKQQ